MTSPENTLQPINGRDIQAEAAALEEASVPGDE